MEEMREEPREETRTTERRRNLLALRLCIAVAALALAMVLRLQGGEPLRAVMAGGVEEDLSLPAAFAELARAVFGPGEESGAPIDLSAEEI